MCLTNDEESANKLKILRNHGMDPKKRYWHNVVGFNYRMTNLQAALGVAQLGKEKFIKRKKRRARPIQAFPSYLACIDAPQALQR